MKRYIIAAGVLVLLLTATPALADGTTVPQHTLAFPTDQIWAFVAGNLAPLVAYVLNYYGPHVSEKAKVVVTMVVAAVAGGIAQAITAGNVGFNDATLQFVVTAVVAAFLAHHWIWQPSTIASALGGGRNRQTEPTP